MGAGSREKFGEWGHRGLRGMQGERGSQGIEGKEGSAGAQVSEHSRGPFLPQFPEGFALLALFSGICGLTRLPIVFPQITAKMTLADLFGPETHLLLDTLGIESVWLLQSAGISILSVSFP